MDYFLRLLAKRSRRIVLSVFLVPLLVGSLFAQTEAGSIVGRVYDDVSKNALRGAIVRLRDSTAVDYTDDQGRFTLSSVPAGLATLEVEYLGLDPFTLTVTVTPGASTSVIVSLTSEVLRLETYTVKESVRGQALAINQQKTASGIINIVSEETFGQMADGNIGQALQRLPGISVNEDQDGSATDINIRGISGEFNSFQIDGNRAPTSGDSRSFNPRQLAADGVTNIEVIKAATPDRDGDAIGGIINVVSRSAFQREARDIKLRVATVWNEQPDKWGYAGTFSYSDLFDVGGKEKNLGISFTVSSYKTDRYSLNSDMDWVQVDPATNPQLNLGQYNEPVWFMEANHWEYDTRVTRTNGLSGSIDFRTDEHNSFYFRPQFSQFDRKGIKFETDIDIDTRFQNAADGRKTYAELTPTYGRAVGGEESEASRGWIGTDDDHQNDLYSVAFGGRHERDGSLLTYDLYYSRSKNVVSNDTELNTLMEPDSPWMHFEYRIIDVLDGDVEINNLNNVDPTDLSLMSEGELIQATSEKVEDVYSARLDWEKKILGARSDFTFKTGAKYRVSEPQFDLKAEVFGMDEDFPYASVMDPTDAVLFLKPKYWDVYPRRGQDLLVSNPELFELNEEDTLETDNLEDYTAEEKTAAAYVMGTLQFGRHTVIGGVRWEKNEWNATNKNTSYEDGVGSVTTVKHGDSYDFWLPGIHLRHELRKNLILRESFNQSYGRARLSELTAGRFINEDGDIVDGNPDLKPAFSNNFDIQLEFYTENGGLYSAGIFYKDMEDFTFTQVYNFNDLDENGIPIPDEDGDHEYERPVNGTTAENYGLELIARQRLFFLPGALKGLSASVSATFTESEANYPNRSDRQLALEGFSDYIFTGGLEYAWGNFHARVDYRYRSDYIEGLGDDIESDEYFAAEERVDAELEYRLRQGLSIFATATNLTDRPQISYQGYLQFVEDTSFAGRKYTFGVEYEF